MPKMAGNHQKLEEKGRMGSPPQIPGGTSPVTNWLQTSGLFNCDMIHFSCFKPPSCGNFTTAIGNQDRPTQSPSLDPYLTQKESGGGVGGGCRSAPYLLLLGEEGLCAGVSREGNEGSLMQDLSL